MNLQTQVKQRGIGLLELMLSLAIIALLLVMATRYYSAAHGSEQLNAAVEALHAIYAAAETYEANNPGGGLSSLQTLVDDNLLPQVFGNSGQLANPWGGTITLAITAATGGQPQEINIIMRDVPNTQCPALIASLAQTLSSIDKVGLQGSEVLLSSLDISTVCNSGDDIDEVSVIYYN